MINITQRMGLNLPEFNAGEVWLVGAGPGDPGLLTLHALSAINQADYILYDALVDEACLALAQAGTVLEFAGKRPGQPSPQQHQITARLIELARAKKRVLRLKGGDPFVFGRGGEEALALSAAEIPFRIIPGITAGIAAPAYAGIPVTSRQINQSVTFITGHDANGGVPDHDWTALSRGAGVLVLYMAMKTLGVICQKLMEAGRQGGEPVAFISHATSPAQKVTLTTLAKADEVAREQKIAAPCIIIIGQAVDLSAQINFLSMREPSAEQSEAKNALRKQQAP